MKNTLSLKERVLGNKFVFDRVVKDTNYFSNYALLLIPEIGINPIRHISAIVPICLFLIRQKGEQHE